jgi:hypothetical protein
MGHQIAPAIRNSNIHRLPDLLRFFLGGRNDPAGVC